MQLIKEAKAFAHWAHGAIDQRRRFTNDPYIVHPQAVAELVATVAHTPEMIAASWLHDTVEDVSQHVSLDMIREQFGDMVWRHVSDLTDVSTLQDGNRRERKAIDLAHTSQALPGSKTIKLADLIVNVPSIVLHDPKFAAVYLPEKVKLIEVLLEGDPGLLGLACATLDQGFVDLEKQLPLKDRPKARP